MKIIVLGLILGFLGTISSSAILDGDLSIRCFGEILE